MLETRLSKCSSNVPNSSPSQKPQNYMQQHHTHCALADLLVNIENVEKSAKVKHYDLVSVF